MLKNPVLTDLETNIVDRHRLIGGTIALGFGLYVYIADRAFVPFLAISSDSLPLLPSIGPDWFTGSFPSFLHAIAFCLLTGGILNAHPNLTSRICWSWGMLYLVLEAAQMKATGLPIANFLNSLPFDSQLVRNFEWYFRHGVFDPFDMVAAIGGCIGAHYISEKIYIFSHLK